MKNTDALAEFLLGKGVTDFFAVTGGAAVHIIDSLIERTKMKAIFHHHEQAASLAADAYARLRNLGVCVVTTGPGVTNALTGLLCSWQDSVPTLFVSGQTRYSLTALGSSVRQVGTQHLEVIPLVKSMTKKAVMLKPEDDIQDVVRNLVEIAQSGRRGPVWLDIPLDIQIQDYVSKLGVITQHEDKISEPYADERFQGMISDLQHSSQPIFLLGRGMLGIQQDELNKLLRHLDVPCVRTWGFLDSNLTIPKHLDFGVVGVSGQRGANKIVSEADFILSLGARWGQAVVGPLIESFAPRACVHIVDIDPEESKRIQESLPESQVHPVSVATVLHLMSHDSIRYSSSSKWQTYCQDLRRFNHEQVFLETDEAIDQYQLFYFLDKLIEEGSTVVIDGGGTVVYCSMQTFNLKPFRQIIIPSASAPMGTGIPQAIGAQTAQPSNTTLLVCGDGSFPFNVQELQTINTNDINLKIIVVNNEGYLSIQGTQDQFLDGRHHGSSREGGLELPSLEKICSAFGIRFSSVAALSELEQALVSLLESRCAMVLEVIVRKNQEIYPRTGFEQDSRGKFSPLPLSQMFPNVNLPNFASFTTPKVSD